MDDTKKGSVSGDTIIKSKYNLNFFLASMLINYVL